MSDEHNINRRTALKVIAVGVGTATSLPVLQETALGQHRHTGVVMEQTGTGTTLHFFNEQELATVSQISELIIPADAQSPGAKAAGVANFIDLMVSESSAETKTLWHDGLAALDKVSQEKFSKSFLAASPEQQTTLLKTISKNEYRPKKAEERFFVAIKALTVDGYYTSQIGIHQELRYKGNEYLKDFAGCTHPEHLS